METKFRIGDKAFCLQFVDANFGGWWRFLPTSYEITQCFTKGRVLYSFYPKEEEWPVCFEEQDLFSTIEEAQAECDRRNNG